MSPSQEYHSFLTIHLLRYHLHLEQNHRLLAYPQTHSSPLHPPCWMVLPKIRDIVVGTASAWICIIKRTTAKAQYIVLSPQSYDCRSGRLESNDSTRILVLHACGARIRVTWLEAGTLQQPVTEKERSCCQGKSNSNRSLLY